MSRRSRLQSETGEGESYYASMTDMMVGVVFIFIIMLGYFASQYHAETSSLARSDDPRTTVLLRDAANLEPSMQPIGIDHAQKIVCVPTAALRIEPKAGQVRQDQRCFSYAEPKPTKAQVKTTSTLQARAELLTLIGAQSGASESGSEARPNEGYLSFDADTVFLPNSDQLSATGQAIAGRVAATLAKTLPCYGYLEGFDNRGCANGDNRIAVVNVLAATDLDPFSPEGQAASALALKRSVAFHRALTAAQPVLANIRNGVPAFGANTQPLLRVASLSQGEEATAAMGWGTTISIQIDMVW